MSQQELLRRVVEMLDRAGIEYMVTGSIASSLQGEPRLTHDLDLVVALRSEHVPPLLESFPHPEFYVSPDAVTGAIRTSGMFNVIQNTEGDKVDFWMLTDQPFDRSRFGRRYEQEILGFRLKVSSPEDTILAKLRWGALSGGSEKQFQDALRVYEVQAGMLDLDYLAKWAEELGVTELLNRLQREAEGP